MAQVEADAKKPPYAVPWPTFLAFMDKLHRDGVPNRIDPTLMTNMSGQMQSYMTGLLKTFDAIDENKVVQPVLRELVDPKSRKTAIADLLHALYPQVVELGKTTATLGELNDAFSGLGLQGDPRRKGITFYLYAANYAGIQTSPLWKGPKAPAARGGTKRTPKKAKTATALKVNEEPAEDSEQGTGGTPPKGDTAIVTLKSGGTVTVVVSVPFWDLDDEDQEFVFGLKKTIKGYNRKPTSRSAPKKTAPSQASPESPPENGADQDEAEEVEP